MAVYLGTAPVFWLPYVPLTIVTYAKYALFVAGVSLIWTRTISRHGLRIPNGAAGPFGLIAIFLAMAPGLFQSDGAAVATFAVDLVTCFAMLWTGYFVARDKVGADKIMSAAVVVISGFCLVVVAANFVAAFQWASPFFDRHTTVREVGFGGLRTGWSFGIALYLPFGLMMAENVRRRSPKFGFILQIVVIGTIVGAQLTVGGRSGLAASGFALAVWLYLSGVKSWGAVLIVMLGAAITLDTEWLVSHLRFDRIGDISAVGDLDHFSASRLSQYSHALSLISQSPIFGHGIEYLDAASGVSAHRIHNFWLRIATQAGVGVVVVMLFFVLSVVQRAILLLRSAGLNPKETALVRASIGALVAGVVVSMFEPNALIGSFQTSATWWMAAGIVCGLTVKAARSLHSAGMRGAL